MRRRRRAGGRNWRMTTPTMPRTLLAPLLRRMPLRSRRRSRLSAWPACVIVGSILGLLLVAGRQGQAPLLITADREIVRLPDGRYAVTETWLMERYELERALRLRAEQCDGLR